MAGVDVAPEQQAGDRSDEAASASAPPNAVKLSPSDRNKAIGQTKTWPAAIQPSAANSRTPRRAARYAPGTVAVTVTAGVPMNGTADRICTSDTTPKATRGPSVASAQPPSSGPMMPASDASASRALIWWPRCSASPSDAK